MRSVTLLSSVFLLLTIVCCPPLFGQAEAQKAFQDAKTAYQAGNFAEAKASAEKAAQTDSQNPEVFLLLGQACYQLGQVDEAMDAWKKTLALAPQEPYAKKMIEVLSAQRAGVAQRITLIEALLAENLYQVALPEVGKLLARKALSAADRAKLLTLQAELYLRLHRLDAGRKALRELLVLFPQQVDPVQTALLDGLFKLRDSETATEAVAILQKLIADHPDAPAAKTAQYELAVFALDQDITGAKAGTLAGWIAANPQHPRLLDAQNKLLGVYLVMSRRQARPTAESTLNEWDTKAFTLAGEILKSQICVKSARAIEEQLLKHLRDRYPAAKVAAAALAGAEAFLKLPLTRPSRIQGLRCFVQCKRVAALKLLREQAEAGTISRTAPLGQLPPALQEIVDLLDAVDKEFPCEKIQLQRCKLAEEVRVLNKYVPWFHSPAVFRAPDAWAVTVVLPLVQSDADEKVVEKAVGLLCAIARDVAKQKPPAGRVLPVEITRNLFAALSPSHPAWYRTAYFHADWLSQLALFQFQENLNNGKAAQNAKLSAVQKELLDVCKKVVAKDATQASKVRAILRKHVQPWLEWNQAAVVEQAYAELLPAIMPRWRFWAELDWIDLRAKQVAREHQRLQAAGFSAPRRLDDRHRRMLLRLYELQADLPPTCKELDAVRKQWHRIVEHYKKLKYDDVVAAAIQLKPEKPVPAADEFAAFQLLRLQTDQARREFAKHLKLYQAEEELKPMEAITKVAAGWTEFIADHPRSLMVPRAVEQVFALGELYRRHQAYTAAAALYADFARSAMEISVLGQAVPGEASVAARAEFAHIEALDAHARKILQKLLAQRKSDAPPPEKISEEFAAAVAAYKAFLKKHGAGPLTAPAMNKVMAVGVEYAKIDAWDVAEGIYADLLASKLPLRRPERLLFARGLCQLGRAMPDHARKVLAALSSIDKPRSIEGDEAVAHFSLGGSVSSSELHPASGARGAPRADLSRMSRPEDSRKPSRAEKESQLLAMVRRQEIDQARQVALLQEKAVRRQMVQPPAQQGQGNMQQAAALPSVLSEAEVARQEKALRSAYAIFQSLRKDYPDSPMAEQARGEILLMAGHWRGLAHWRRAGALVEQFLADNPDDRQLPQLRLQVARDLLAWASKPLEERETRQKMLAETARRFQAAREALTKLLKEFPREKELLQTVQWEIPVSFLTEARVVGAVSATLARGQFVRAAKEFHQVALEHGDHPRLQEIPPQLDRIAQEMYGRGYYDEAIAVWELLVRHDPLHPLAQNARMQIALTYHQKLKRPLRAAEAYQELLFSRGGGDGDLQNRIFQIGSELKVQKRWVESLHVLETFVDSFPRHPQAGRALAMVGQIHQTNEAWADAIAAYKRVIDEFPTGPGVQEAKWSVAECTINLSQWREAQKAYRDFVVAYPKDPKVQEANRRIEILKDLVRYQGLVDEKDQRKAFDAQFQIAAIVRTQLSNPVKAIIEYHKVASNWPDSHLADDALFEVGSTYLRLGETVKAREALHRVAEKYPTSPLADDALFLVGKSYEDEAAKLARVTRAQSLARAKDIAQRQAYADVQRNRRLQEESNWAMVHELKAAGKGKMAEIQEAAIAGSSGQFNTANVELFAQRAEQEVEALSANELADRQDKVNAALRKAVDSYTAASKVAGGDKADDALLSMATIYDQRLKDAKAAMQTWLEIVRQFSGTRVAEDASWKIAQFYEREGKYAKAVDAYQAFLRNYRRSPNAGAAQFAIAENYEHLGQWVNAMDSYTNYITNFPKGPLVTKAREQINWIKTYRL